MVDHIRSEILARFILVSMHSDTLNITTVTSAKSPFKD